MAKGIGGTQGSGQKGIGGAQGSGHKGISGQANTSYTNSSSSNSSGSGDCFVATAAYGTPLQPEIQVLRDWRDNTLCFSKLGRAFIRFYYQQGPKYARLLRKHPSLKSPVRAVIKAFIRIIK